MKYSFALVGAALALAACTQAQLTAAEQDVANAQAAVTQACAGTLAAAAKAQTVAKGGALNTVNDITSYAVKGCESEQAIAALAVNPASAAWLNGLATQINSVVAPSANVAPAATPAP